MKGSGLRVDTQSRPSSTNTMAMSFDRQSQGYMPRAELTTNRQGQQNPSTRNHHQRQTSQTHVTPNFYSQRPSSYVPQSSHRTVQVDVSSNYAAQTPPLSAQQYHQYLRQRETASKQYGQEPLPPRPVLQASMGHWVHSMPKAHPAHVVAQSQQYADPNGQPYPLAANHAVHQQNRPEDHGWTSVNRSSNSNSHLGRQYTGASQPAKSANGHRVAGPPQSMPTDPRGQQVPHTVPATQVVPAKDLKDRQALIAAWRRLEMLERSCDAMKERHERLEQSCAVTKEHHERRLSALESKHEEGLMAARADMIARYRDAHGQAVLSTSSREGIEALAVYETTQADISTRSPRLPSEKANRETSDVTATPLVHTGRLDALGHRTTSVRDTIELTSDIDSTSITPCHKVQARKLSKVEAANVRQRSTANDGGPNTHVGRYNMRKRVQGRVQKPAKKRG